MGRGQKAGPKCKVTTGPRAKECKGCGHKYEFVPKFLRPKIGKEIENWSQLEKGDIIKVVKGSGPYWLGEEDENGVREKVCVGYSGKFKVMSAHADGLCVYGVGGNCGYAYLLMVIDPTKGDDLLIREPYKLAKV